MLNHFCAFAPMHSSGASSASLHQRARGRRGTQEFNYQRQQRQKQQQFQAPAHHALTFVSSYQPSPWSTERIPPAPQIHAWMKRFDLNRSGALEREELFALLSHLHPENPPNGKALDLLMEKAPRKPSLYTNHNSTSPSYPDRAPRG